MRKKLSDLLFVFAGILTAAYTYAQTPSNNENYIQKTECFTADCIKKLW